MTVPGIVQRIRAHAESRPGQLALEIPGIATGGETEGGTQRVTFGELWEKVCGYCRGLEREGFGPKDRMVVMLPVSVDLYALMLALFARGTTAVFLDTTDTRYRSLTHSLKVAGARGMVSTAALLRYRFVLPRTWGMRLYSADGAAMGVRSLSELRADGSDCTPLRLPSEHGAIVTFTSGSTGLPKGVNRTHGVTLAQHLALARVSPQQSDDRHMTCLPVLALHNLCSGVPTVLPAMDLRRVADMDARRVTRQLRDAQVTRLSGGTDFIRRLTDAVLEEGSAAEQVRHVAVGGAPVSRALCARIRRAFPRARCEVFYGSSEAEPISHVDMADVIEAPGAGHLVGLPDASVELAVVHLPEGIEQLDDCGMWPYRVADGEEGEVVVRGDHVVQNYLGDPESNRRLKLRTADGGVWHRTGDVARRDAQGRLWLTGRTADLVPRQPRPLAALPVEDQLNALPGVRQAAFIAHQRAPRGEVLLAVEDEQPRPVELARSCLNLLGLSDVAVHTVDTLPLDPRHNAKLDRPALRRLREATA